MENRLRLPFEARWIATSQGRITTQQGETAQVLRMAPEDACSADMLVLIRWQGRTIAVLFVPTGRSQLVLEGQGVG